MVNRAVPASIFLLNRGPNFFHSQYENGVQILFYKGRHIGLYEGAGMRFIFDENIAKQAVQDLLRNVSVWSNQTDRVATFEVRVRVSGTVGGEFEVIAPVTITKPLADPQLYLSGTTTLEYQQGFTENAEPVVLASGVWLEDRDSPNFAGGRLQVELAIGAHPASVLGIRSQNAGPGQITVQGDAVFFGDLPIGTVTGGSDNNPLVINFNEHANVAAVKALAENLTFVHLSEDPPATQVVSVFMTDGDGGFSRTSFCSVNITAVNDTSSLLVGGTADYGDDDGSATDRASRRYLRSG